jgi:hypothetical protein
VLTVCAPCGRPPAGIAAKLMKPVREGLQTSKASKVDLSKVDGCETGGALRKIMGDTLCSMTPEKMYTAFSAHEATNGPESESGQMTFIRVACFGCVLTTTLRYHAQFDVWLAVSTWHISVSCCTQTMAPLPSSQPHLGVGHRFLSQCLHASIGVNFMTQCIEIWHTRTIPAGMMRIVRRWPDIANTCMYATTSLQFVVLDGACDSPSACNSGMAGIPSPTFAAGENNDRTYRFVPHSYRHLQVE